MVEGGSNPITGNMPKSTNSGRTSIKRAISPDLDREQAFQLHGYVRELLERRHDRTPLPAQLRRSGGLR